MVDCYNVLHDADLSFPSYNL